MIFALALEHQPLPGSLLHDGSLGATTTPVAVGGFVGVNLLQKALRDLAIKAQNSDCDPSKYDGTFTLGTVVALANTAAVLGKKVHEYVGKALNIIGLIKKPFDAVPYGSSVVDIILSPWLIDSVYEIILGIIRLFPGGGSVATGISSAVNAFKAALATAASPLAGVIALATTKMGPPPPAPGAAMPGLKGLGLGDLGADSIYLSATFASKIAMIDMGAIKMLQPVAAAPSSTSSTNPPTGFTWVNDHWERIRVGQTAIPGPIGANVIIRDARTMANPPVVSAPLTGPMTAAQFLASVKTAIKVDHRPWPKGKPLSNYYGASDWDESTQYEAKVPMTDLYSGDAITWRNQVAAGHNDVKNGTAAFRQFTGKNAQLLGAFYDKRTGIMRIRRIIKKPSKKGHWYDFAADIVDDIADFVQSSWDWVKENAGEVYNAVKKYGCLIVNNDIVVAAAAGAAGIVATPAAAGAVVSGAAAGRAACTALTIGEAVYAIIKFLSMGHPPPPPLTDTPTPTTTSPTIPTSIKYAVSREALASIINLKGEKGSAGFSVVMPGTPPVPPLKPSDAFPMPPGMFSFTTLTPIQLAALGLGGLALGAMIFRGRVIT